GRDWCARACDSKLNIGLSQFCARLVDQALCLLTKDALDVDLEQEVRTTPEIEPEMNARFLVPRRQPCKHVGGQRVGQCQQDREQADNQDRPGLPASEMKHVGLSRECRLDVTYAFFRPQRDHSDPT